MAIETLIAVPSKGSRGTGLGLPVSQKIMREHGGDILVTSELGKGTSFRLILPVSNSEPGEFERPIGSNH